MVETGLDDAAPATVRRDGVYSADAAAPCDLVTVPARHGLEAVDIMRLRTSVGPVLHDGGFDTLGFVVPAGTAEAWDVPGSACTRILGRGPGRGAAGCCWQASPPVSGTRWLVAPEEAAPVTDPQVLREALGEAVKTLEAADR